MGAVRGTSIWLALFTWSGLAGAVTAPHTEATAERGYALQYRAAASCPDAAALAQAIEARTPRAVQQSPEVAAVQLRVELREDGTSTLWVDLPEGGSRREFPEAACADAVASIAVIASMVLEADASERAATVQSVMERVAPAAPTAEPTAPEAVASPPLTAPPPAVPPKPRRPPVPPPEGSRLRFAVAAGALLESAVASDAGLGASAGIAVWLQPGRPSIWVPRIQAEALASLPATVQATQGAVKLGLVAGRLHLCPLRWPIVASLAVVPCVTGDLGVLRARGVGATVNPQTPTMPWLALGGTVRAQLALGRVAGLESWLGLRGLARADTFVFGPSETPDSTAYQVPRWSLGAGLGLTLALP